MTTDTGTLYYGDCLDVLRGMDADTADLVYLDPPFNSARAYNAFFGADAQVTAFEDTWQWGQQAQREKDGILRHQDAGPVSALFVALTDSLGPTPMAAYLVMMTARLLELRRVLKPSGSLWLHCDPTASHYLKIVLDGIFGKEAFRNEIIWKRANAHSDARNQCPRVHDVILFYGSDGCFFAPQHVGHDEAYIRKFYRHRDPDGRRYRLGDLTSPQKDRPNLTYDFHGVTRVWRWTKERMEKAYQDGIVVQTRPGGVFQQKRYLDEMPGFVVTDIWDDIPQLHASHAEHLGYPTQKPVALLERIISMTTREGDLVLDPFCGCGTTVHAAQKLGRRWIGIDITHLAITLVSRRLKDAFPDAAFEVTGTPRDVESARYLAESNGLEGRYQFQFWALSLIGAIPAQGKRKGSDGGADGLIWAYDSPTAERPFRIIVSVKSGRIPANHIRELAGMLGGDTKMAILLTLEKPSKVMLADAARAGDHVYPGGQAFPRIQILAVEDLLAGTARAMFLDYREGEAMFRRARRERRAHRTGSLLNEEDAD